MTKIRQTNHTHTVLMDMFNYMLEGVPGKQNYIFTEDGKRVRVKVSQVDSDYCLSIDNYICIRYAVATQVVVVYKNATIPLKDAVYARLQDGFTYINQNSVAVLFKRIQPELIVDMEKLL